MNKRDKRNLRQGDYPVMYFRKKATEDIQDEDGMFKLEIGAEYDYDLLGIEKADS